MSSVKITGNASGTAVFEIASPGTSTNRTLTLPDATGTVQVSGNPISGTTGTFTSGVSVGPSVTFGDATVQTTAAVAPTTATVLAATAGASVGAVGTYAWLWSTNITGVTPGGTKAGSNLRYAGNASDSPGTSSLVVSYVYAGNGGTPAGTWRAMGLDASQGGPYYGITLWLRIS
jgi:hypothetical protein